MGRLIDSDVAIKYLGKELHGVAYATAYTAIDKTPTAQQWTPCSETVDIPEHEVLCCDKYEEELIGWLSCKDDQWLCESEVEIMYDPVAWMEKPKPWKGEQK